MKLVVRDEAYVAGWRPGYYCVGMLLELRDPVSGEAKGTWRVVAVGEPNAAAWRAVELVADAA